MIATRHTHLEVELIHWIILALLAAALVLAAATVAAADPMEPQLLPGDMGKIARPIPLEPARPFFPETPPVREIPPAEAVSRVWVILDHHEQGRPLDAIAGWQEIRPPAEAAHWREIAMGAAYLERGNLQRAAIHLENALQMTPENAVVAYYFGLLRLEQGAAAARVPDGNKPGRDRLVAFTPAEDKAVYDMLALNELRKAAIRGPGVRLEERLLEIDATIEEQIVVPCVDDLLTALGADNFAGKAHHLLFGLHLDRAELVEAEQNLDMAAATGLATLDGYRDLAETYLAMRREADGLRAIKKDLRLNHPWIRRVCERLVELTNDGANEMWVW